MVASQLGWWRSRWTLLFIPALPDSPKAAAPVANRETKAMRDWARRNGFEVSRRGRIPAVVIAAFQEAHASEKSKKK